ncbi:MAG: CDP-alcohol phosphatidyltransferase family protein [Bacillota bacterium]|nr:CDP-alcohol phosphatidyltransferase family protein [Bacillota bacterium]
MNVPNALSALRIVLVPAFIAVFLSDGSNAYPLAVLIFLFAGLTDILDGIIARRFHLITRLGRILDPLADKLMILSALVCVSLRELLPWWVAIVYFVKEAVQLILGAVFFKRQKDVPSSNVLGKSATVTFYIAIAVLILFENISYLFKIILFLAALLLALAAFATYYFTAIRIEPSNGGKKQGI